MPRILHFSSGTDDWKAFLADPDKHWKTGFSARSLAHCWEAADGLPAEIASMFRTSSDARLRAFEPIFAIPEYKVELPGGTRSSQNDIFVLGRAGNSAVTLMVEGKVNESFGPTIAEWYQEPSPGKVARMAYLLGILGLSSEPEPGIRYQLLHRCASPLIEAARFRASAAVMIVQSFTSNRTGWSDFVAFCQLFEVDPIPGALVKVTEHNGVPLHVGWADGDLRFTTL